MAHPLIVYSPREFLDPMKWIMVVAILVLMSIVAASANKVDDLISDLKSEQDGIRQVGPCLLE
jgi:uncharacterized oligopeptide transporter (OPT) family protein